MWSISTTLALSQSLSSINAWRVDRVFSHSPLGIGSPPGPGSSLPPLVFFTSLSCPFGVTSSSTCTSLVGTLLPSVTEVSLFCFFVAPALLSDNYNFTQAQPNRNKQDFTCDSRGFSLRFATIGLSTRIFSLRGLYRTSAFVAFSVVMMVNFVECMSAVPIRITVHQLTCWLWIPAILAGVGISALHGPSNYGRTSDCTVRSTTCSWSYEGALFTSIPDESSVVLAPEEPLFASTSEIITPAGIQAHPATRCYCPAETVKPGDSCPEPTAGSVPQSRTP